MTITTIKYSSSNNNNNNNNNNKIIKAIAIITITRIRI